MKKCILFFVFLAAAGSALVGAQERFRRIPPSPDPIQPLRLPAIESYVLSNSMAVTVVHNRGLPLLNIQLIIAAGEKSAPDDLTGLASFTANMVKRGTEALSASDIDDRIEAMGGRLDSTIYPDFTIFTLSFLEEHLDDALDVLSSMVMKATFPQREITNVKTSLYYAMVQKNSDPEYLARRLLFKTLFADHSYRRITYSEDAFIKMNRASAIDFYDRFYRPNHARMILVGNINLETATRKVSHYFNLWTKNNLPMEKENPPEPAKKVRVCFISQPGAEESVIMMGNILSPFEKNDYFPFSVFNHVFGETPNSRLFFNLRESKGYAYNAYSHIEMYDGFGVFRVQAWVRPEVTTDAIKQIFAELDRAQKQKIPNIEIEEAKSYLIGNFPIKMENGEDFSARIADLVNLNLGREHWNGYYEAIMRISADSVSRLVEAQELLSPVIVVVGDEGLILDDLAEELGEIEIYDHKGILVQTINKK